MHSILALAFLAAAPPKVDGPYTHGRLAVYLVRGPETDSRSYITLDEGLKSVSPGSLRAQVGRSGPSAEAKST